MGALDGRGGSLMGPIGDGGEELVVIIEDVDVFEEDGLGIAGVIPFWK